MFASLFAHAALLLSHQLQLVSALENGLARTPPRGWSSWNAYNNPTSPSIIAASARALKALGLRDLGYVHVDVDGAWYPFARSGPPGRTPAPGR